MDNEYITIVFQNGEICHYKPEEYTDYNYDRKYLTSTLKIKDGLASIIWIVLDILRLALNLRCDCNVVNVPLYML